MSAKQEAIRGINKTLTSHNPDIDHSTMLAIYHIVAVEMVNGDKRPQMAHMNGLGQMVQLAGGPEKVLASGELAFEVLRYLAMYAIDQDVTPKLTTRTA